MVRVLLVATKYKNVKIKIIYATVVKYYQLFYQNCVLKLHQWMVTRKKIKLSYSNLTLFHINERMATHTTLLSPFKRMRVTTNNTFDRHRRTYENIHIRYVLIHYRTWHDITYPRIAMRRFWRACNSYAMPSVGVQLF